MHSTLRRTFLGMAAVAFSLAINTAAAQPSQVGMGSWKLNLEKSKYNPGPAPKSITTLFEPAGKGVKLVTESVNADGSKVTTEYTANYDGKDVPLKGSSMVDTISLVRPNPHTTVRTDKKAGKVVQTLTRVVAKDGKTFTVAVKGTNAKGQPVDNMLVFDKQ